MSSQDISDAERDKVAGKLEHSVFRGLVPRNQIFESCDSGSGKWTAGVRGAIPFMMSGTLATSGAISPDLINSFEPESHFGDAGDHAADYRPSFSERLAGIAMPAVNSIMRSVFPELPPTYIVEEGDTISSVADTFGVPTPAVLTLNGLNWNTVLHPGQVLKLSAAATKKVALSPPRLQGNRYTVQNGESMSVIAERFGVSISALKRANNFTNAELVFAGQEIRIPGTSRRVFERGSSGVSGDLTQNQPAVTASAEGISTNIVGDAMPDVRGREQSEESIIPNVFDAADLKLADRPSLITVKIESGPKPGSGQNAERIEDSESENITQPTEEAQNDDSQISDSPSVGEPVSGSITPLNQERRANAQTIINVGKELGVSDYGIVIALATAMQESSLRNINWGDRDSVGLFQQRPSSGWGAADQIVDPVYSAKLFFGGPSNPNKGRTRGLLDISGWENMALTEAAQKVQISAYPEAYAKWEPSAWAWLYELT